MRRDFCFPAKYPARVTNGHPAGVWQRVREVFAAVDLTLALWHSRASYRRELARSDERLAKDLRIDPIDLKREANKPFWRE